MAAMAFLVGMTTEPEEFRDCLKRPRPVGINLFLCYFFCPVIAVFLGQAVNLSQDHFIGMVLVGSVSGGNSSNLQTLIARGDVPLSILMTLSGTLLSAVATPLLCKVVLQTMVPVDVVGILVSASQMVLLPIVLGLAVRFTFPRNVQQMGPAIPAAACLASVVACGTVVANGAAATLACSIGVHMSVVAFHAVCGVVAYWLVGVSQRIIGLRADSATAEVERRTVTIEVMIKNGALASVLAVAHFSGAAVQAPTVLSSIWCPLLASVAAAVWRRYPVESLKSVPSIHSSECENNDWVREYSKAAAAAA